MRLLPDHSGEPKAHSGVASKVVRETAPAPGRGRHGIDRASRTGQLLLATSLSQSHHPNHQGNQDGGAEKCHKKWQVVW